jgi:ubiquinone/menaquinone biosynthesis C-methylase UbiE
VKWMTKTNRIRRFDRQASAYAKRRRRMEMGNWRQKLLRDARGDVLEIAVGAGANFPFYSSDIRLTAVDFSPAMLQEAKTAAAAYRLDCTLIESDVESLRFPPDSFDSIVSTLSLCSYDDPVQVLQNMSEWCRPEGRILLLEHGISSQPVLAALQKLIDPIAFRIVGCHQKRDIMRIIRTAGLHIERDEHYMANMLHLVWAKPQKQE